MIQEPCPTSLLYFTAMLRIGPKSNNYGLWALKGRTPDSTTQFAGGYIVRHSFRVRRKSIEAVRVQPVVSLCLKGGSAVGFRSVPEPSALQQACCSRLLSGELSRTVAFSDVHLEVLPQSTLAVPSPLQLCPRCWLRPALLLKRLP